MKLLRNPVVVGILAVLAFALVIRNVIWPMFAGPRRPRAQASAPAAPAPAQRAPAQPSSGPAASINAVVQPVKQALDKITGKVQSEPVVMMDQPAVLANATHWVSSPRRDPFNNRAGRKSRAEELLTLKSVWRQTGSKLAVINNRLLAEGDTILEFTLEKIEVDHVWVTGPDGREALTFKIPSPPVQIALESSSDRQ